MFLRMSLAASPDTARSSSQGQDCTRLSVRGRRYSPLVVDLLRDSTESAAMMESGAKMLGEDIARIDRLREEISPERMAVAPGSRMFFDNEATEYDPLSDHTAGLVASAVDHLETLRAVLPRDGGDGILPAIAGFTLLRSALETSALTIWLLSGGTMDKRVLRSLRLTWNSRGNTIGFTRALNIENAEGRRRMEARLEALRDKRPRIRTKALDVFPKISDIFRDVDHCFPSGAISGLSAWQAMSSMAHGNRVAMQTMLERRVVSTTKRAATYSITSSLIVFSTMTRLTVDYTENAISRHITHATTLVSNLPPNYDKRT